MRQRLINSFHLPKRANSRAVHRERLFLAACCLQWPLIALSYVRTVNKFETSLSFCRRGRKRLRRQVADAD